MLTRNQQVRFEVKDRRRLTFYAAIFNHPTTINEHGRSYREVISPTAFDHSLASRSRVTANLDHDDRDKFASYPDEGLLLGVDPHGLFASAWIPETPEGDRILQRVQAGELDGCSFRFSPVSEEDDGTTVKRTAVALVDVCLTSRPAYEGTRGTVMLRSEPLNVKALRARYALQKLRAG